ncbi:MAG: hypothetical protein ABFC96_16525 [Thermoguttaceae bacterium]
MSKSRSRPLALLVVIVVLVGLAGAAYCWLAMPGGPRVPWETQAASVKILEKHHVFVTSEKKDPLVLESKRVTTVTLRPTDLTDQDKKADVDEEVLRQLVNFSEIQTLDASDCKVTNAHLREFGRLTSLASLVLRNTEVTDQGLAELQPLGNLRALYIDGTAITDAGLKDIAALRSLTNLELSSTKVTDAGLKELVPLTNLKWLLLSNTAITDAGLKELAALPGLTRLTIIRTKATPAGIAKLKQANSRLTIDVEPAAN